MNAKYYYYAVILFCLTLVFYASQYNADVKNIPPAASVETPPKNNLNNTSIPEELLAISNDPEEEFDHMVEENKYGTFFGGKAQFFIIDSPENNIFDSKVNKITLYKLDGKLCRTKYFLQDNISNQLIKEYGDFQIKGFDEKNKKIIDKKTVVERIDNNWGLNKNLDNYRLTWKQESKEYKLRVNKNDEIPYKYFESITDYKQLFRALEYAVN